MFNSVRIALIAGLLSLVGSASQAAEVLVKWSADWPALELQERETRQSLGDLTHAAKSGGDYYLVFDLNKAGEANWKNKSFFCFVLPNSAKFAPGQDETSPTGRSCWSYPSAKKEGKKLIFDLTGEDIIQ